MLKKNISVPFFFLMDLSCFGVWLKETSCYPNQPSVLMKVNETLNPNYQQLLNNYPQGKQRVRLVRRAPQLTSDWQSPNYNFLQPHDEQLILQSASQESRLFLDCFLKLWKTFVWRLSFSLLYSSTFSLLCRWLLDC